MYGHIPKLIITEPPRTMKSSMVAASFPAFVWAQGKRLPLAGPHVKFIGASYNPRLSIRDAIKTRRIIDSPWFQDRWGDRFHIMADKDQKAMYENSAGGFRFSTSIEGGLTGEGGDIIICLPAGVMVETDHGPLPIEKIVQGHIACRVLGYDTSTGKAEWQAIEAYEANHARPILELDFGSQILRCTGDHPIFTTNRGYVPAQDVTLDDTCLVREQQTVFGLPEALSRQKPWDAGAAEGVEEIFLRSTRWLPAEPTFNVRVGPHHNYFANGILVHNCDDPINAKKANWESARESVNTWWDETVPTRLNDQATGAKIIIMQRLHEDDLVGHVLGKEEGWVHLNLPMEWDPALDTRTWVPGWSGDEPFFQDPRTEEGELLWPERFPAHVVEDLKTSLGPFASAAQLQQQPSPRGGGIIDRMWWQVWDAEAYQQTVGAEYNDGVLRFPRCSLIVGSIDTAYGEKDENAWNAMTTWGVFEDKRARINTVLMEAWRLRAPLRGVFPPDCETEEERRPHWGLSDKIADTVRRRQIDILLIENKTRGADLENELRRLLRGFECQIVLLEPEGNKVARLYAVQPMFADQRVFAPEKAWADTVINEVSQFPKSKFADYTDTVSQALMWLRKQGALLLGVEADAENLAASTFRSKPEARYDV